MYLNSLGISTLFCKIWLSVYCEWVCCMYLVVQACLSLCDPMGCSWPGSSVHGISQAKILEWVAMPSCKGSSWLRVSSLPRDPNHSLLHLVHCRQILYRWAIRDYSSTNIEVTKTLRKGCLNFFFFRSHCSTCGILFLPLGTKLGTPLQWKPGGLTTGLPGKPQKGYFLQRHLGKWWKC